jgi:hypothetical protein
MTAASRSGPSAIYAAPFHSALAGLESGALPDFRDTVGAVLNQSSPLDLHDKGLSREKHFSLHLTEGS